MEKKFNISTSYLGADTTLMIKSPIYRNKLMQQRGNHLPVHNQVKDFTSTY